MPLLQPVPPEVQKLVGELGRVVASGFTRSLKERGAPEMFCSDEMVGLAKALLSQPAAVYISGVEKRPEGAVVRGGAEAGEIRRVKESSARRVVIELPAEIEGDGPTATDS